MMGAAAARWGHSDEDLAPIESLGVILGHGARHALCDLKRAWARAVSGADEAILWP